MLSIMCKQNSQIIKLENIIENVKPDTTIVFKRDTIHKDSIIIEKQLIPTYITKIKTDTLYKENGDTVQLITESKRFDKQLTIDSDTADVEIYTSGINTSLDSLKMALKTHKEILTKEIEITKYIKQKPSRWNCTFGIGSGYGLINHQSDIYVGVTLGYKIF